MFKFLLSFLIGTTLFAAGPDCTFHYRFTNIPGEVIDNKVTFAPGLGPTINNFGSTCTAYTWSISYGATGLSALSVQFEDAPLSPLVNIPGVFNTFNGQSLTGTNPLTSTTGSLWTGVGYYPYVRLNVTTFTGTGAADIFIYGWTSPSILGNTTSGGGGSGSVTSVGLSLPSIFSVTGSPVTSTGNLTGTLTTEAANTFFAGPDATTGLPIFRTFLSNDMPVVNSTVGVCGDSSHVAQVTLNSKGLTTNCVAVAIPGSSTPLTTKGDIYTRSATADARQAVGANGTTIIADSSQPNGWSWVTPPTGVTNHISSGLFSALPATSSPGDIYFATDKNRCQQIYLSGATNSFYQFLNFDGSGSLFCDSFGTITMASSGTGGVARYGLTNPYTGYNDYSAGQIRFPESAFASLPVASSNSGKVFVVTNASASGACDGAGSSPSLCRSNGTSYLPLGGGGSTTVRKSVNASQSTGQTITGGFTGNLLLFDTNDNITDATMHSTSSSTGNFVIPVTGYYEGQCKITSNFTSSSNIQLTVFDGANIVQAVQLTGIASGLAVGVDFYAPMTAADVLTCVVSTDTTFTTNDKADNGKTNFYVHNVN